MILGIAFGFLISLIVLVSGWLKLLISFISISLANGIPFLYFFLGIYAAIREYPEDFSKWAAMITSFIVVGVLTYIAGTKDESSTVGTSGSGYIIGLIIGLIFSFIF